MPRGTWLRAGRQESFFVTVKQFDPAQSLRVWVRINDTVFEANARPADYPCLVESPIATATATATETATALPSDTPIATATATESATATVLSSDTPIATATATESATATVLPTETATALATATETEVAPPSATATPTDPFVSPLPTPTSTATAVDPLPTPTATATTVDPLPTPGATSSAVEVYVLDERMFAMPLSAAEKAERWRKGLPVPLAADFGAEEEILVDWSTATRAVESTNASLPAMAAAVSGAVDNWNERDDETFEETFPNPNRDCVWSRTQRASGGQGYIWGEASDRSVSPIRSLWPAGAVNADAPVGTQPLPPNSSYPVDMITSVICQLTGMENMANVMTEFQLWFELGDAGDSLSVQFFSASAAEPDPVYRGGLAWRGGDDAMVTQDWTRYRIYYPDLAADSDTVLVKWKFISDANNPRAARGPWLDDLSVWNYQKPASSVGCENENPTFGNNQSKGLVVPPYAEDILNSAPDQIAAMIGRLQTSGVNWVRLEFQVKPENFTNSSADPFSALQASGYNRIDLRHYDRLIDSLCASGVKIAVLGLLDNQTLVRQDWFVEGGEGIVVPNLYVGDFVDVSSQLVEYFDDRIGFWEIWNEPDHTSRRLAAAQYAELLKQTYAAIKNLDPNDKVLFGGLGGADRTAKTYFDPVVNALLLGPKPFDIFALHPYYSREFLGQGAGLELDPAYYMRGDFQARPATILQKFRETLDNDGLFPGETGKAIWATELGWNSAQGAMNCTNYQDQVTTEAQQACYLQRGFHSLFNLTPTVEKVFWYQYHDTAPPIESAECGSGSTAALANTLPSPSWRNSDVAAYLISASGEQQLTINWWYGLYHGDFQVKPAQEAFHNYPMTTEACMVDFPTNLPTEADLTEKIHLPIVQAGILVANGQ